MASNSTFPTVQQAGFGSFVYMCQETGSYPFCNLFWRQVCRNGWPVGPSLLPLTINRLSQLSQANFTLPSSATAPVGIQPRCGIPRASNGRFGNIANIVVCVLSIISIVYLSQRANRRRAAVGKWPLFLCLRLDTNRLARENRDTRHAHTLRDIFGFSGYHDGEHPGTREPTTSPPDRYPCGGGSGLLLDLIGNRSGCDAGI